MKVEIIGNVDLVVYICYVHRKMDVITEVIRHNPTQNVLCDIVSGLGEISLELAERAMEKLPCMAHVSGIVYGRSTIVPFDTSTVAWDEFILDFGIES
jgi:hypothetical protein